MDATWKDRFHSLHRPHLGGMRWHGLTLVLAVLLILFLTLRLVVSPLLTSLANRRLADLPEYAGHVGSIQITGWRGTVQVEDFTLWTRGHEADGPLVQVKRVALSPAWLALLRGKLGGAVLVQGADVAMVQDGPAPKPAKSKEEKEREKQEKLAQVRRWQGALQKAFPLELTRFEIANSRVRFRDVSVTPNPEMAIEQLNLVVTGVGRPPKDGHDLPAAADFRGLMTGNGRLTATVRADPLASQPRFEARMEVRDLSLSAINAFMREYAKVNVTAGTFAVFTEVSASGGHYSGYVKPFFRDLEFTPVEDKDQGAVKRLATKAASAMTNLLKNEDDKVATKVPFEGNFADNEVDIWTTIENLLRNAFVQSLQEGLEGQRPAS